MCKTEVFSRPCGFFRPVQSWNPGKVEEFKERKKYTPSEYIKGKERNKQRGE